MPRAAVGSVTTARDCVVGLVGGAEIDCASLTVATGFYVVVEALVLFERRHARCLDGRNMHEAVGGAIIWLDKAVALVAIEKFYGTDCHFASFQETDWASPRMRAGFVRQVVN